MNADEGEVSTFQPFRTPGLTPGHKVPLHGPDAVRGPSMTDRDHPLHLDFRALSPHPRQRLVALRGA